MMGPGGPHPTPQSDPNYAQQFHSFQQQLYATNSAGNQIDLNIKSGTSLLIDGTNVMTSINNNTSAINNLAVDISGSVRQRMGWHDRPLAGL